MAMRTFYDILEVAQTASQETITAAYRSLCKRCHPDTNRGASNATERLKEINQAYETLSDPVRRCYDESLRSESKGRTIELSLSQPVQPTSPCAWSSRFTRVAVILIVLLAAAWVLILVTDSRVLIWQTKVEPGQSYYAAEYGDLGRDGQASLVGRYFNGRGIITRVFWYSSNNMLGRDSCPFILRD